jgi:hypothetical protein
MPPFDHWLITRFNVPMARYPGLSRDEAWLTRRISLFRTYCLPSIARQTCRRFRWLFLVDFETPTSIRDQIRACAKLQRFEVLRVGVDYVGPLAAYLDRHSRRPFLITSRLDSDDALRHDYLQAVQDSFDPLAPGFLRFQSGLKLDSASRSLFSVSWACASFLSLIERRDTRPRTVYFCAHNRAHRRATLRDVSLEHAWLQVVHDQNIVTSLKTHEVVPVSNDVLRGF